MDNAIPVKSLVCLTSQGLTTARDELCEKSGLGVLRPSCKDIPLVVVVPCRRYPNGTMAIRNQRGRQAVAVLCLDWCVYLLARVLICIIQALSLESCQRLSELLASLFTYVIPLRRSVIEDNLQRAFPEGDARWRTKMRWAMWQHLCLMICEISLMHRKLHDTNWRQLIELHGGREMVLSMFDPRPSVFVTAHYGNFELNGYLTGLFGFPSHTLARELDNPFLHRFLIDFRESSGQYILPTRRSADLAQRILESGGFLAALGDHHAGAKGCWVNFFGRPASCHKGVAVFALANKSPINVVFSRRTGGPFRFEVRWLDNIDPSVDPSKAGVDELTQWYTEKIESFVREDPKQYWWLHRRWKDFRSPRQRQRHQQRIEQKRSKSTASLPPRRAA